MLVAGCWYSLCVRRQSLGGRRLNARDLRTLDTCLFEAFANPKYSDPQDRAQLWAVVEAMRRIDPYFDCWRPTSARKGHECVRGCVINDEHVYFKQQNVGAWDAGLKICASCMAMILHVGGASRLPPYIYSHWDSTKKRPVRERTIAAENPDLGGVLRLLKRVRSMDRVAKEGNPRV